MRVPISLLIARRYLLGKKSTHAINIITWISIAAIAVGTGALILILSVFNGFENLSRSFLDKYNPDIRIEATKGKFIDFDESLESALLSVNGIAQYSKVIEEVAHFEYEGRQQIGIVKGVDDRWAEVTGFSAALEEGSVILKEDQSHFAIVGSGVQHTLRLSLGSILESLKISLPNRNKRGALDRDFKTRSFRPGGIFTLRNDKDQQYIIADYDVVAGMLDLPDQVTAIEVRCSPYVPISSVKSGLIKALTDREVDILDRLAQDATALKIMNIEKWSAYFIFSFTLLLIIFNVIGCLWMIVLEKRKDLAVLQSFGATKEMVRNVFYFDGLMIAVIGFLIGFGGATVFYILQKTVGIIRVPDAYAIDAYPMQMEVKDVLLILLTVLVLGLLASLPAAIRAGRVSAYVSHE